MTSIAVYIDVYAHTCWKWIFVINYFVELCDLLNIIYLYPLYKPVVMVDYALKIIQNV